MKLLACSFAALAVFSLVFCPACKKTGGKTKSCSTTLYGYNAHLIPGTLVADSTTSVGVINTSTALLAGSATVINSVYSTEAAFNTSDNCYYTFKSHMGSGSGGGTLYKINGASVTTVTGPVTTVYGLTYDRVYNKFYCFGDASNMLAELSISGSSYALTNLVSTVHPFLGRYIGGNITQDDNTGAIYYVTGDTSTQYIEKYVPGGSPAVVATVAGGWDLLGLRFMKSTNMLYAVKEVVTPSTSFYLLRIDPSTGTSTTLTTLSSAINREFYSACTDPCSSKYIFTNRDRNDSTDVTQYDVAGAVLQHNVVPGIYQGLSASY